MSAVVACVQVFEHARGAHRSCDCFFAPRANHELLQVEKVTGHGIASSKRKAKQAAALDLLREIHALPEGSLEELFLREEEVVRETKAAGKVVMTRIRSNIRQACEGGDT